MSSTATTAATPRYVDEIITDGGGDPDDIISIILACKLSDPGRALHVTTTLYEPAQKAQMVSTTTLQMGRPDVKVYAGYGASAADFEVRYPYWDKKLGIPGRTNKLSLEQGKAYLHLQPQGIVCPEDADDVLLGDNREFEAQRILALGPLTNVARLMEKTDKIHQVMVMGGFYGQQSFERLGFNLSVDPAAAEKVFTQTQHPVIFVNSEHSAKFWDFSWSTAELIAIFESEEKTPIGEAIARDFIKYLKLRSTKSDTLKMSDVLTTWLWYHPELIKETTPVRFEFKQPYYSSSDPQVKEMVKVHYVAESNIRMITGFTKDISEIRNDAVYEVVTPLFFKSLDSFKLAVENSKGKDLKSILDRYSFG